MLLFIRPAGPLEIGESLSGARALYVPFTCLEEWALVEKSHLFRSLAPEDQEYVRRRFPEAVRRFQCLFGNGCSIGYPLAGTIARQQTARK